MRYYLITSETMGGERKIEVLHSTSDGNEAVERLVYFSNSKEPQIIEGRCRIIMTTYEQE